MTGELIAPGEQSLVILYYKIFVNYHLFTDTHDLILEMLSHLKMENLDLGHSDGRLGILNPICWG